MTLLHAHSSISDMSSGELFSAILDEVVLHSLLDSLKIVAFLFLAYLFMEFIEHKATARVESFIKKAGMLGPLAGGALGVVPQCGFSTVASNFYTARVISMGSLIAVFLSTSDEMLPIMISGSVSVKFIFAVLGYKLFVAVLVGFAVDFILRMVLKKREQKIDIDEICENDNCHCERGILHSAIHHTLTVGSFVLLITFVLNLVIFLLGEEKLASLLYDKFFVGHLIAALFGLVPNCAVSVALTELCVEGYITVGTMLSGLFSGSGVGLLVLFKVNKRKRENILIIGILVLTGLVFGMLADAIDFSHLLA
ncbi:MAG: arsenic efflux protein [Clostridia bacterium]|nr:arsenic efflux protein [Clostridia bacterium]